MSEVSPPIDPELVEASKRRNWRRAAWVAASATVFIGALALAVRAQVPFVVLTDIRLAVAATDLLRPHGVFTQALLWWQEATQPRILHVAAAALCLWWWTRHREMHGGRILWGFCTLMVAWSTALGLKLLVQRDRPDIVEPLELAPGYSFPSGHAANAAAIALGLVLVAWPLVAPPHRRWLIAAGAAVAVITGVDRVLLGVHYLSDVVAGWVFGSACVATSYLLFRHRIHRVDDPHLPLDERHLT